MEATKDSNLSIDVDMHTVRDSNLSISADIHAVTDSNLSTNVEIHTVEESIMLLLLPLHSSLSRAQMPTQDNSKFLQMLLKDSVFVYTGYSISTN